MNNSDDISILIDIKKGRIRIHKNTLHALGDPEYINLVINPHKLTIGILVSSANDQQSHKIKTSIMRSKLCMELYSHSLITQILSICPDWLEGSGYRITGRLSPQKDGAFFDMCNAIRINAWRK